MRSDYELSVGGRGRLMGFFIGNLVAFFSDRNDQKIGYLRINLDFK